ncbi:hypothetical protein CERSUDRAFT_120330 [Gelatoporia subvermispora B]|uniref:Uncharacterized protein n=1 Tax=Ceriporiopsis subvermispora (strain B) TaxID=914234 RepID=M2QXQ9_CERS8|nr:hypothetical protein CERSUDRAFT_120330 [Gelatoporia subvermispora B]
MSSTTTRTTSSSTPPMMTTDNALFPPTTPSSRDFNPYTPLHSSPLASASGSSPLSPKSSPVLAASARRRAQYKSQSHRSPTRSRRSSSAFVFAGSDDAQAAPSGSREAPRKAVLRERFRARCMERERRRSARMDDDMEGEDVDDDEGEEMLNDELMKRIMQSAQRKKAHRYRVEYQWEVGSSFDPDMEDVAEWEAHLGALEEQQIVTPEELEEDELLAYAEELMAEAENADLEGLDPDALFSYSDVEDMPPDTDMEPVIPRDKGKGKEIPHSMDDAMDITG